MHVAANCNFSLGRHGPVRTAEIWFHEELHCSVDIAHFMHVERPIPCAYCTPEHTIVIDVSAGAEALLAAIKECTRTEIRRAERDGAVANLWLNPDDATLREFSVFYNHFARQKKIAPLNKQRLRALRQSGLLAISNVVAPSGEVLVWHSYVCAGERARLLQSASLFRSSPSSAERNAVGRVNRFLHYKDMLAFKTAGARVYDLGGWYAGNTNAELLRINRFKEEFGGKLELGYNCECARTLLGKCALMIKRVARRLAAHA